MTDYDPSNLRALIEHARSRLGETQAGFAIRVDSSKRTVSRWQTGRSTPASFQLVRIAREVYPLDGALAVALATAAGTDLLATGIEVPEPPRVEVAEPPPAPPPKPARPGASVEHLVDSVLCAAAAAVLTTPQAIRPAIAAAFERAIAVGLTPEEVSSALQPATRPTT